MSTVRRRTDPYSVVVIDDPDLEMPEDDEWPGSHWATETKTELDRAWKWLGAHPDPARRRRVAVVCDRECCRGRRTLADVYATPPGMLYVAEFVRPRDSWPSYREKHPDTIMVYDPWLEAADGRAPFSTRRLTTRHSHERRMAVWDRLAAGGTAHPRSWTFIRHPEPNEPFHEIEIVAGVPDPEPRGRVHTRGVRVRDLLDRGELDHVPLRAKCGRGGEVELDAGRIQAALPASDTPTVRLRLTRVMRLP